MKKITASFFITIISLLFCFSLSLLTDALTGWEYITWNWREAFGAKKSPAADKIKIILLDQSSLDWARKENHWPWPWPREAYAPLLKFCARSGAKLVVFDVLFTEPSFYGITDDDALGAAIHDGVPFIGALFLNKDKSVTLPIAQVATNAELLASVRGDPDSDGVTRRAGLFNYDNNKNIIFNMGTAAFVLYNNLYSNYFKKNIKLDKEGRVILRFCNYKDYQNYTAASIIQSQLRYEETGRDLISPENFTSCCVFFGFSAPGLLDLRTTPLNKIVPGVYIHATLFDNLLSNNTIYDAGLLQTVILAFILVFITSLIIIFSQKLLTSLFAFLPLILALIISFIYYNFNIWLPTVIILINIIIALIVASIYRYATEDRQKRFIKKAFKHYLSPAVIEAILKNPNQLKLGGERRELTIFFSDLQGFSSIAEKLSAQELTSLLNNYLSDMTDIILETGGTLDKYEGDAIIAFWNAPLTQDNHASIACRAAVFCQKQIKNRSADFERIVNHEFKMRIGLNTGEVVVGNMGSQKRFDYTVLGDAANLASRLEGANKIFNTFTMISEDTKLRAGAEFLTRELGLIRVVGRTKPVRVFELIDFSCDKIEGGEKYAYFAEALALCREGQWENAALLFNKLITQYLDAPSKIYLKRCNELINNKNLDWDCIWNLTEK